jgi:hypothetical protein
LLHGATKPTEKGEVINTSLQGPLATFQDKRQIAPVLFAYSEDLLINPQVVSPPLKWWKAQFSTFDRPIAEGR